MHPDAVAMHVGQKALIRVLGNDAGPIDPASLEIVDAPQSGTAVPDGQGRILYTHEPGSQTDSFSYRVSGAEGWSAAASVSVEISNSLRVSPSGFAMPAEPPPNHYQFVEAFGGLQFNRSTAIASIPGDAKRLFICEAQGRITLIHDVSASTPVTSQFMDLPAILAARSGESIEIGAWQEHGLLGLAFHPRHLENGYFFVFYTVKKAGLYSQRVSRFSVRADNPNAVDPASERILIEQPDRELNHNGGDMHFGPDGYLYFSAGDEGPQYDLRENSQKIDLNFFSGIFRIDVDCLEENALPNPHPSIPTDEGVPRYRIPADNPFLGVSAFNGLPVDPAKVRAEFWATGLRSPWRFSFDPENGDLWCGDVGQDQYEEVNLVTRGGNYGWVYRDGAHEGFRPIPEGFQGTLIDPIHEYVHATFPGDPAFKGNSVIGGLVYRGSRYGGLQGAYLFGDWDSGNIWTLRKNGGLPVVERITGLPRIAGFALDPSNGDVLAHLNNYGNSPIYRLSSETPVEDDYPQTLGETGLFADLATLSPNPGLLPYEPKLSFWSDHALKRRWFAMPDLTSKIGWAEEDAWSFPEGALWVKHFDIETERGNPATKRRLETRVLVKNATGVYGVSYRWNEAQTDAVLSPQQGEEIPLNIVVDGQASPQTWRIPSRADCLTCHNEAAGGVLSFETRQLNRQQEINGFTGNMLRLLDQGGFFETSPGSPLILPRHVGPEEEGYTLEAKLRSYLAVNCSYCHRPGGGAPPSWDARAGLTLAETRLVDGLAVRDGGDPSKRLVVKGDASRSILLHRLAGTGGFSPMPPLGSSQINETALEMASEWISSALSARASYEDWRLLQFGSSPSGQTELDPDGDGVPNSDEFLWGSSPHDAASRPRLVLSRSENQTNLSFDLPADRVFRILSSDDLAAWQPWEIPGNDQAGRSAGRMTLGAPGGGNRQFFRVEIREP
ncbi:hypothetical protein HHL09_14905 [Luteolibacter luteus]|uniref:Glucose/Sorbosone dehydrogenase domain-containing protein n=1 Tax=Luteolibacter luteus TaxID=2728835 RepID=A0A858RLF7_9BACT|nr:hypothetical protein HHL09_14905 [Luteolibacter luteus]